MKPMWKDRILLVAALCFFAWVVILTFWVIDVAEESRAVKVNGAPIDGTIIFKDEEANND